MSRFSELMTARRIRRNNIRKKYVDIVFIIMGIMMLVMNTIPNVSDIISRNTTKQWHDTTAVISSITPKGRSSHAVKVRFSINGIPCEVPLNTYQSGMKTGNSVEISYNTQKTKYVVLKGSQEKLAVSSGIIGTIFLGLGLIIRKVKKQNQSC